MQTQVMDRPIAEPEVGSAAAECSGRKTVISTHRGVLVCLDVNSVVGCVQVEKLTRLPGSHDRVEGVLLFRGDPVPLVSVRRDPRAGRRRKHEHEEHALIVFVRDRKFAIRVDAVPSVLEGPLPYGTHAEASCVMRRKHVERFLALCVLSGNETIDCSRVPDCRRAG